MAKGIYYCFISLLLLLTSELSGQDTIMFPLHIRAGFDAGGLAGTLLNKNHFSYGVNASYDLNEAIAITAATRFTSFTANEPGYDYSCKGFSILLGPDFNLLKPKTSHGIHYIGTGIHYGLSFYTQEAPRIEYSNPWGTASTAIGSSFHTGHFIELTPGVRTEILPWLTIGWNISMRLLLSDGTNNNFKPVHMPGYGDATKRASFGACYYISISVPLRTKRVITRVRTEPEEDETETTEGEGSENISSF